MGLFNDLSRGVLNYIRNADFLNPEGYDSQEYNEQAENCYVQAVLSAHRERESEVARIKVSNPNYSNIDMIGHAKKLLLIILESRNTQTLDHFQHCLTRNLYTNMVSSYNALRQNHLINYAKDPVIIEAFLGSYEGIVDNESINLQLKVKFFDYYMDSISNRFVKGNRYDKINYKCNMTFIKNYNYNELLSRQIINCPNCGGVLDEVHINVCNYCGTVVPLPEKQWLLSDYSLEKSPEIWPL